MTTKPLIGNFSSVGDTSWTKSDGTQLGNINGTTGALTIGSTSLAATHKIQSGNSAGTAIIETLTIANEIVGGAAQAAGGGPAIVFRDRSSGGGIANHPAARIRALGQASNNAHGLAFDVTPDAGSPLGRIAATVSPEGAWTFGTGSTETHSMKGKLDVASSPDNETLFVKNTNGSYTSRVLLVNSERTSSTSYQLISAFSGVIGFTALEQFSVRGDGQIFARFNSITLLSDQRFKENIQPIPSALNKICQLNPVSWDWIDKAQPGETEGFVAQELDLIYPDLVDKIKEDEWHANINGSKMISRMVKAIQELKAELDAAKARITELEGN